MRRFSDWFVWIPLIALVAAFFAGLLISFASPEPRPSIDPLEWFGK